MYNPTEMMPAACSRLIRLSHHHVACVCAIPHLYPILCSILYSMQSSDRCASPSRSPAGDGTAKRLVALAESAKAHDPRMHCSTHCGEVLPSMRLQLVFATRSPLRIRALLQPVESISHRYNASSEPGRREPCRSFRTHWLLNKGRPGATVEEKWCWWNPRSATPTGVRLGVGQCVVSRGTRLPFIRLFSDEVDTVYCMGCTHAENRDASLVYLQADSRALCMSPDVTVSLACPFLQVNSGCSHCPDVGPVR